MQPTLLICLLVGSMLVGDIEGHKKLKSRVYLVLNQY